MDDSKLVGSVFLDLSKAFALVSHDILSSKIAKYHASQPTLRWFRSYLCDRTQTCAISGVLSDPLTLTQDVPQGSILGPVLFSLYINDLPLCLPASDVEIYADDTTLWNSDYSIDNIQQNLQNSLNNASRILAPLFCRGLDVPTARKDDRVFPWRLARCRPVLLLILGPLPNEERSETRLPAYSFPHSSTPFSRYWCPTPSASQMACNSTPLQPWTPPSKGQGAEVKDLFIHLFY